MAVSDLPREEGGSEESRWSRSVFPPQSSQTGSSKWNFTLNCKEATSKTGALAFLVCREFCSQFWTLQPSAFLVTCLWWRLICKMQVDCWPGWETPAKPWNQYRLREGHQNSQVIKKSVPYQAIRFQMSHKCVFQASFTARAPGGPSDNRCQSTQGKVEISDKKCLQCRENISNAD